MLYPDELVKILKFEGLLDDVGRKNTFEERIKLTLQAIVNSLPLKVKYEQKDSQESLFLRKQADHKVYKEKGKAEVWFEALELYTKSIAKAEKSSTELAQAYANRSAVLYHLNKHQDSVNDINRALALSYPDQLRPNLLRRKAKCLKILGNLESEKVIEEARIWLENISLSDEKKEKIEAKINMSTQISMIKLPKSENQSQEAVLPNIFPHEKIPSASNAIDIEYNKDFGIHLVANRDIGTGEILINEKPYAKLLSSKNIHIYCSHCFVKAWALIPCENCVHDMYCSEECKNEAWKEYHDIECHIKKFFLGIGMNALAPFSLKLTVLAVRESGSIENLRKELKEIDKCEDYLIRSLSEDGCYYSNKYKPIYNLITHEADRDRYQLLILSLNAALTMYYLVTLTSFLGETTDEVDVITNLYKNKDAMFVGKLIAHHCMTVQINDREFDQFRDEGYYGIGTVIGSVVSLLNHSCKPNVGKCPVMKDNTAQQVIYALHPIKKGNQLFIDYGCCFTYVNKSKRKEFLKNYFFKCNCTACTEDWPSYDDLPSVLTMIKNKEMKIEISRAIVRSKNHEKLICEGDIKKFTGDKTEILENLARSITILFENTKQPNREYIEMLELFCQAFMIIYGNKLKLYIKI